MLIKSIASQARKKKKKGFREINNKTLKTSSFGIKEILSELWRTFQGEFVEN